VTPALIFLLVLVPLLALAQYRVMRAQSALNKEQFAINNDLIETAKSHQKFIDILLLEIQGQQKHDSH